MSRILLIFMILPPPILEFPAILLILEILPPPIPEFLAILLILEILGFLPILMSLMINRDYPDA